MTYFKLEIIFHFVESTIDLFNTMFILVCTFFSLIRIILLIEANDLFVVPIWFLVLKWTDLLSANNEVFNVSVCLSLLPNVDFLIRAC